MKNSKNKILNSSIATALVASTLTGIPIATASADGFNDLPSSNTHYDNIINLLERGIINGFPDGTFKPGQAVTRGQAAKILASLLNLDTQNVSNPNFDDLPETHQFYGHIAALVEAGIINGFPDGNFKQNDTVTRGQLSKMLVKAFQLPTVEQAHPFSDVSLTHEYSPYIASLYELGVTTGKTASTYDMKSAVTRGQFASFVVRAENNVAKQEKISGTIEKITKDYVTIDGTKYKFNADFKFLSLASNEPALKDATISVTIKDKQLHAIDSLHILANAEKINFQGSAIHTISLPDSLELLKDVQANKISYSAIPATVKFDQVTAETVDFLQGFDKTASLAPIANVNRPARAIFSNSVIGNLHVAATQTTITNENSSISNLHALAANLLTLSGTFQHVYIANLSQLLGTASIAQLHSSSNNFSAFNLSPTVNVLQGVVNNTTYNWSDFVARFMSNQPSVPNIVIPSNPGTNNNNNNVISPPAVAVDTSKLKAEISKASALDSSVYTTNSVATLTAAVTAAQKIIDDTNATQAQVDSALTALTSAITGLTLIPVAPPVVAVDTSKLKAEIAKASALDSSAYTAESVATLTAAITAAQKVVDDTNATQAQADTALTTLTAAISGLTLIPVAPPVVAVDTSKLKAEITKASALDSSTYTAESVATLTAAISAAQKVVDGTNGTQAQVDTALTALTAAISGLTLVPVTPPAVTVDISKLQNQLKLASALDSSIYTAESVAALNTAIFSAQKVIADTNATQTQVDDALTALTAAITGLVSAPPVVVVDLSKLQTQLSNAIALDLSVYTAESVAALDTAISSAQKVVVDANATQTQVDNALTALTAAITGLVSAPVTPPAVAVDMSKLQTQLANALALDSSVYTAESVTVLNTAISSAQKVIADTNATQAQVDDALTALVSAITGLISAPVTPPVVVVDLSKLQTQLANALAPDSSVYTAESVAALNTAISSAQKVIADTNATQAQVDDALTALTSAITGLVSAPVIPPVVAVDMSKLKAEISKASALDSSAYTAESVATLTVAISAAQKVVDDTNATQAQVDDALTALTAAITGLISAPVTPPVVAVDMSKLKAEIAKASALDSSAYTTESVATLNAAIFSAQKVVDDTNATQAQVDTALTALTAAITDLVLAPVTPPVVAVDMSKLKAEIAKASALDSSAYTTESVATLTAAISSAQKVVDDTNASQAQVDDALIALTAAITGLISAPPVVAVDTSKLKAEIAKASALDSSIYTADSLATLTAAISAAQKVIDDKNVTQTQVDTALTALTLAITNLVVAVDTSKLKAEISKASVFEQSAYTTESFATLAAAISAAQKVIDDKNATQTQVDTALTALTTAITGLVLAPVAPTEVQTGSPTVTADNMLVVNDQQYVITAAHQSIFNGAFGDVENVIVEVENNEVKKIKALTLAVTGNTLSLEDAPEIGDLTVTGDIQVIDNVAADTLTIQTTASTLQVQQLTSNEVVIAHADSSLIAKRSLLNNRIAVAQGVQFAQNSTTSKLEITFDGDYAGKTLTIQRSNVTVDTNPDAQTFSTIDIQSNDVTINANQLANVSIKKEVLATTLNANVASLTLELQDKIEISSDSPKTIGELLITAPATGTDGWISLINITLGTVELNGTAITNPAAHEIFAKPAVNAPATFAATAVRDGNLLGKIKFNVDSTITTPIYYKFITASDNITNYTNVTSRPTDVTEVYVNNSSLTLYNDVTAIILYTVDDTGLKIAQLTPPSVGTVAIDKSFGSSTATFKINTTYRDTVSVKEALKYFVILKEDKLVYSDTSLTNLTWEKNNGLNYVEITVPKTINGVTLNNVKELYVTENALSLGGSGTSSPSGHYIPMLKNLAKLAQSTNNPNMIRILLSVISATSAATFDSLFLKHYVDELVANENQYNTADDIKQLLTDLTPEYNTAELMTKEQLLLASAPLEQFEYSTAGIISNTVADGKLVFTALNLGSTTVRVVDAAGNATLVSVTVDANKNITKQEVLATVAQNGYLVEGNDDFRYVEVGGQIKIVATKLQNALAIIQTNKTDTDLLGTLTGVYVSNVNGAYTMTNALTLTPQIISYADLGLPNGVTSLTASKVGGLTLTDSVALYPRIAGSENIKVSDGTNSTALTVNTSFTDATATVELPEIAKSAEVSIADDLKLEAIKTIDIYPNTTNVHVYESGSALQLFANEAATGSVIVKDIQDKSAILNFETKNTNGKITVTKFDIVKSDLENVVTSTNETHNNTGATIQNVQGSSLRQSQTGLVLYAVAAGTTQVTLSNGKQYSIEVKLVNNQYVVQAPVAITNMMITAADLHMSDFDSATTANQTTQLYKISNNSQLIVSMAEAGTATIVLKSSAAVPQQTIIHVTKNADGTYSEPEIDRAELTATELGLTTLTSVSNDLTTTARAVTTADKLYIYGFQDGERTFKVTGGSKTTVVNTTVSNTAGNYEITANPVIHDLSAELGDFELSDATFSSVAAHVKDGILYATGNGLTNNSATIEVPIKHKTTASLTGFYTIKVSYNEATKAYAFEDTGVITFKKSISMEDLGLTSLDNVIVPTGSKTTAVINGDKLDISASESEETRIQVIGNGSIATAYIYVKRDATGLTATVEKSEVIDVSDYGLNGVTTSNYLTDMLRATVSNKAVTLYALKTGTTTYTATDSNNQTVLMNITTELADATNSKSARITTADVVSYDLTVLGASITGTIIEGDAVRIHDNVVYAVKNNATAKVLLSDGRIVQFTVTANLDTHYEMDETIMTNSLTVAGSELDLTGNLTATGHNPAILSKTEYGNNISVYGVAAGKTSLTISGANSKSAVVNFTVTKEADNSFKVTKEVVSKTLTATPILIDAADASLVRIEGAEVYGLAAGKVELLVGNEIKQITISVADGHYTMSEPVLLGSAIYTASDLGFASTSGLTIASNSNESSTYAAIVEVIENNVPVQKLVAYSKLTGTTTGTAEIIIKSTADTSLQTLVQVNRKLDAAGDVQLTSAIAEQDYTAFAATPIFQNPALVRFDAVSKKLYALAEGHTYATVGTDLQAIHVTKDATTGEYKVNVSPLTLVNTDKPIAALPGNGTDLNVVRLDTTTGIIYATGLGTTKVQIDGQVYEVHVTEAANKLVTMTKTAITSSSVTAQQLGLTELTSATVLKGNANAIQFVRGDDSIVLYSNGASTAQTVSLLVEGTIGTDTTKYHAVINIKIAEDGSISEAKAAATTLDVTALGFSTGIDEVVETDQARAVWNGNTLTIYALEAGTTAFEFDNALVNTTVSALQTNLLQATTPAFVFTEMPAAVDTITNGAMLTEIGTKLYAKDTDTALVNVGADVYTITVTHQNGHYSLTKSAAMKSVTFDLEAISGTVATAGTVLNGVEKAISETSNKLVIYATANTGVSDIMITSGGVNTLYHTTVTNGIPSELEAAVLQLDASMADAELYKGTNVRVDADTNKLYLLAEGNAVLKLADGRLINVNVTRINGMLTATAEFVKYELKEAATFAASSNFKLDGTTLYAITDVATDEKVFTTNYRVVASTTFEDGLYKLNVSERQMKKFKLADYGLTATTVVAENTPADVAFAEVVGTDLIIYAGTVYDKATLKVQDTVDNKTTSLTFNVTNNRDGAFIVSEQANVNALKFADMGLDTTANGITAEGYNNDLIAVTETTEGLNITSKGAGTTSIVLKQGAAIVGLVNVIVGSTDGNLKATATPLSLELADATHLAGLTFREDSGTYYPTATGNALYETSTEVKKATFVTVSKNAQSGLYSIQKSEHNLATITATALGLTTFQGVDITGSTVTKQLSADAQTLYLIGHSNGSAEVRVSDGTNVAVIVADNGTELLPAVVVKDLAAATSPVLTTEEQAIADWSSNEFAQVRNNKLYALKSGKTVLEGTLNSVKVLMNVSIDRQSDLNFDIKPTVVKATFTNAPTLIDSTSDVIEIVGKTVYAQKEGIVQIQDGTEVKTISVSLVDGHYKLEVSQPAVQHTFTAADLGVTEITNYTITPIIGSDVISAKIVGTGAGNKLVVIAKQTGEAKLTINSGDTTAYFAVTEQNSKLVIAEPTFARVKIENVTTDIEAKTTNDGVVRFVGDTIYALKEGKIIATVDGKLYNVVAQNVNGKLAVNAAPITVQLVGAPTEDVSAFMSIDASFLASAKDFTSGNPSYRDVTIGTDTYRIVITEDGVMSAQKITQKQADIDAILPNANAIVSTNTIVTAKVETVGGKKVVELTPNATGHEYVTVTDGTQSIQLSVTVTGDANNLEVVSNVVSDSYNFSHFNFYATGVTHADGTAFKSKQGVIQVSNGIVTVYPGEPGTAHVIVNGNEGKKALYVLTVTAGGSFTFEPFTSFIAYNEFNFAPTAITQDGTATAVSEGTGLRITYIDTTPTIFVVKNEGTTFKTVYAQAVVDTVTNEFKADFKATHIQNALVYTTEVTNVKGAIRTVTHNVDGVDYTIVYPTQLATPATGTDKLAVGSFTVDGKIYNVTIDANYKLEATELTEAATATYTTVEHKAQTNVVTYANGKWQAIAEGKGMYKVDGNYVQIEVKYNSTDDQYEIIPEVPTFKATLTDATNLEVLKGEQVFVDGNTVFGFTDTTTNETAIVRATKDSKTVLYTGTLTATNAAFTIVKQDLFADPDPANPILAIDSYASFAYSTDTSSVIRIEGNDVYALAIGTEIVTLTTKNGLRQQVKIQVKNDYTIAITPLNDLEMTYALATSLNMEESVMVSGLTITFTEAINQVAPLLVKSGTTATDSNVMITDRDITISAGVLTAYTATFELNLEELKADKTTFTLTATRSVDGDDWSVTFETATASPKIVFKKHID